MALLCVLGYFQVSKAQSPGGISADLELWLTADLGTNTTTNGGAITSWSDQGPNGHHATGTGDVTYISWFSNFHPGLNFTDDAQPLSGSITRTGGTASTLFVVGEIPSVSDKCFVELGTSSNRTFLIDRRYAGPTAFGFQTNSKAIWAASDQGGTSNADVYENGANIATQAKFFNTSWTTGTYYLGDDETGGNRLTGEIAEVIYYDQQLSAADQIKVESYLALKYGITLDNSGGGTAGDYISSDSTTLWDADINATYHHDVTGIGRDDSSGLDQRKATNSNPNAIVIMDKGAAFASNEDFILWGNDDLGSGVSTTNPHPSYNCIMDQTWKVSMSGTPGTVSVSFVYPNNGITANYALLLDATDADFSFGATAHTTGITINVDTITFTGVSLSHGMYFTLGMNSPAPSPGGVSTDLELWLKSDLGLNTTIDGGAITSWKEAGMNRNHAVGTGDATFLTSFANYNPGLDFANDAQPISGDITRASGTESTVFVVGQIPSISDRCLVEFGTSTRRTFLFDRRYAGNSLYTFQTNSNSIWAASDPGGTTSADIYENGLNIATRTKVFNTDWTTGVYYIGDDETGGNRLTGEIAEAIFYDQQLSATDQVKVETYLALKYGITLDNSSGGTAGDYVASDGTTIWDADLNDSYHNDVIGIGRDDDEALYQKQSHTPNDSLRIYVDNLQEDNSSNIGAISNDSYLIIGNNGGALRATVLGNTEQPVGIEGRIEREWKITNTNFNESYSIEIEWDSVGSFDINDIRLLIDSDGDFSDATVLSSADGLTFSVGSIVIRGITTTHIPANSTRFVTVGSVDTTATPLPIELLSFSATPIVNNYIELKWQTLSEINNDYFTIERSQNLYNWEEVQQIDGAGNSSALLNYSTIDQDPLQGVSYYRLKQTDFDGQFEYSSIRGVNLKQAINSLIDIYPNPTENYVNLIASPEELKWVKVFNCFGQDVTEMTAQRRVSNKKVTIDLSLLNLGMYYVKTKTTVNKVFKY